VDHNLCIAKQKKSEVPKEMSIRDFITFYTLTISFISFMTVVVTLVSDLDCYSFLAAWPLLTNFIALFYNYLSIDVNIYRVSLV